MGIRLKNKKAAIEIGALILGIVVITIASVVSTTSLFFMQGNDEAGINKLYIVSEGNTYVDNTLEALLRYETGGKTTREHLKSNTPVNEVLGYMKNSLDTQEIRRKYQIDIVKDGSTDVIGQADPLRSYTSEIEIFQENEKKIKVKLMVGVEPIFMCVQIADIGSVCPNNYWKTHMWNTLESCEETRDDTSEPVGSLCSDYSCTCRKVAN